MKKLIKGIVVPVVIAIMCGFVFGRYIYGSYKDSLYSGLRSSRIYLVENGEYETMDDMRMENSTNNYIYYKDNDKYKSVVGITRNYKNVDKIKKLYNDSVYIHEYYIPNDIIDNKQDEYDNVLASVNDLNDVRVAVDNILSLYKSDNSIKLIQVN